MNNNGWIKIHRKIMDNCIYKNAELFQLFIHCLLKANHKPNTFLFNGEEITVHRGQFITGRNELGKELNQIPKTVYNRLQILKKLGILDIKTNNKFSLVSVIKYNTYQDIENNEGQQKGQPKDNQRTTRGQQKDTNKNDKNVNNDNNDNKKDLPEKTPAFNLQNELRLIFEEHYLNTKKIKYYYTGKDAGNLKQIINKIKSASTKENVSDNDIINGFRYILNNIQDTWIIDNLDIPTLNSKFSVILSQIKNGKAITNGKKQFDPDELIRGYAEYKESQGAEQ